MDAETRTTETAKQRALRVPLDHYRRPDSMFRAKLWLSLIAAGRSNSVASDLLYSPRLTALLHEAGARFDHVVIDSPPSLVLSDARTISRLVEGVLMVVSDETERNSLLRTKQMFDDAGVRFLGFVMNRVDLDNMDYGYYRDYGYGYRYAEESDA